jgi:hypothetical protein
MSKRLRRRTFAPGVISLEDRRLLALSASWIGQDGNDYVGTELLAPQRPNDYQDIHFRLTGMSGAAVTRVYVQRQGGGAWVWESAGASNAFFRPDVGNATQGDLFLEPYFNDPTGRLYELIRVEYAGGGTQDTSVAAGAAVDPNKRMPTKMLGATFQSPSDPAAQDWTNPSIAVGPDGFKDFKLAVTNLSAGAEVAKMRLTAQTVPPKVWEFGTNEAGNWSAELLNRTGENTTLGTVADFFASSDANFSSVQFVLEVEYKGTNNNPPGLPTPERWTNRSGKKDTYTFTSGTVAANLAVPVTAEVNLLPAVAHSTPQDAAYPGNSHVQLDGLPFGKTFADVRSALLSNRHGANWRYVKSGQPAPYTDPYAAPMDMAFNATTGIFDFPPVRDEIDSSLTLLLTFTDGKQAVARFAGASSDISLRAPARGTAAEVNVTSAADLLAKLALQTPNIRLKAGTYTFSSPLALTYPVRITSDAGIVLTFAPSTSSSAWNSSSGAIRVESGNVSLEGFQVRFQGNSGDWANGDRAIIRTSGAGAKFGLSFRNLDLQGPAARPQTITNNQYEPAVKLMAFGGGDNGEVANNILKGGEIVLGNGPWKVVNNDYRGTVANTIAPSFLSVVSGHDLTISGNWLHNSGPSGINQRFLVYGNSDNGQSIGGLIENNRIENGIGMPTFNFDSPGTHQNAPEMILQEMYVPRFEGKPSSISPDGYIVQISGRRGPAARPGDVVSILNGPYAGQWRMIAQPLGAERYLLDSPLPVGASYDIAIGRGYVNQVYRGNVIDLRGTRLDNVGLVLVGNNWGNQVVNNQFYGDSHQALRIEAAPTQDWHDATEPAPWGWTHQPLFGLKIEGNLFSDVGLDLRVPHGGEIKSNGGRTYYTGTFAYNQIRWTTATQPAVTIGQRGTPDYVRANYAWIDFGEIRLTTGGNWGKGPSGAAPVVRVLAATLDGVTKDNQSLTLPTTSPSTAVSLGQDGRDYIGSGSTSTSGDGWQDIHIALTGLDASKTISWIQVGGYGGGEWRYNGGGSTDRAVFIPGSDPTKGDLYVQPYQNETGREFSVKVYYTDSTTSGDLFFNGVYANHRLPMLVDRTDGAAGTVTARGENAPSEDKTKAFDNDANTKWLDFSGRSWIQYQFANGAAYVVSQYTITSANDTASYPGRAPKSWAFKGSNDGVTWTLLDFRDNEAILTNSTTRIFDFANSTAFKMYRLDGIVSNGDAVIQVAEIQLRAPAAVAISAGGSASGAYGADANFSGGSTFTTTNAIDTSGVPNPAPMSVYQNERFTGTTFSYTVPSLGANASYTVRLHFAENFFGIPVANGGGGGGVGSRKFHVSINGNQVLTDFDIYAAAGGANKAVARQFAATADGSGAITITFTQVAGGAKVNGIEITPVQPNQPQAVDLSSYFNLNGISSDSATAAANLDATGNSLSAERLGAQIAWEGSTFALGGAGRNNVLRAAGQVIKLPASRRGSRLKLLGMATNGNQSTTFLITYTDGTSESITRTFGDWHAGGGVAGQSVAKAMPYRNTPAGQDAVLGPFYVYGYTLETNPAKQIASITLPTNADVKILAMNIEP